MKTILFSFVLIFFSSQFLAAQNKKVKTETFKVWGNCSMCKKSIENAADLKGVKAGEWNKTTKLLTVSYDTTKISSDQIQLKIAEIGYDTEKHRASDKTYDDLHGCCKYERKKE